MPYTPEQCMWRGLLKKYKTFKCLWYKNEANTYTLAEYDAAWEELAEMCKGISDCSNKLYVQRRIKYFRTVFQREKKKVERAEQNGKQYEPTIFYYDILKSMCDNIKELEHENSFSDVGFSPTDPNKNTDLKTVEIKEELDCNSTEEKEEHVVEPSPKRLRHNPARILARRMAEHLEQMDADQALIAEKVISDICVYGRLKQLNLESSIVLK